MQTFLPWPDLVASVRSLDDRRLGKQRVETYQVLRALTWPDYAWKNHPAVRMWRGFVPGLVAYGAASCDEWRRRGYADSVLPQLLAWSAGVVPADPDLPPWFGVEELHRSHRAALVRKDPAFYLPRFGAVPDEPYLWPPDAFPRWPVRGPAAGCSPDEAARLLGHDAALPAQEAAATALRSGRDVLAVVAPGAGGRALGLVAGLVVPGTTLWRQPRAGAPARPAEPVELVPWREVVASAPAAVLARDPSPVDLQRTADEAGPSAWRFADERAPAVGASLVVDVVTTRGWGPDLHRGWTGAPERADAPVLVVAERADAGERAALVARHGLRDPVRVGAGWDVRAHLDARRVPTPAARRDALVALVASVREDRGAALVVCDGRARADRVVALLIARGLRAASWDPRMRASRASAAVAAWRSRRLDALCVGPLADPPPLGRVRPALVVHDQSPAALAWRADVAALDPPAAALLCGPGEHEQLLARCVRAALLDPLGEPVAVPCGRCRGCPRPEPYPVEPVVSAGAAAAR